MLGTILAVTAAELERPFDVDAQVEVGRHRKQTAIERAIVQPAQLVVMHLVACIQRQ